MSKRDPARLYEQAIIISAPWKYSMHLFQKNFPPVPAYAQFTRAA